MAALLYMLGTTTVNGKTVWSFKKDLDISSTSSYDQLEFNKSLGSSTCTSKKFEWLGIQRAVENKDPSWNSDFSRSASTERIEKIHSNQTKEKTSTTHGQLPHKDRKGKCPKTNWTVPVSYGICTARNIQCEFAMVAYNEILIYISYSLCLAFRLCFGMIVFYRSLEIIKLAFLENESRYICCIFANFIFTFETKCLKKKIVMCILQAQSVTLFVLYFYCPHELESGNTYNKK